MVSPERQSARMSKIKNGGLDQYGAEPFEHQQFGPAGVEGVKFMKNELMTDEYGLFCQIIAHFSVTASAVTMPV